MTGSRDDVLEPSVYDLARESARVEGGPTLVQGQMPGTLVLLFVWGEPVKLWRFWLFWFEMFLSGDRPWLSPEMGPNLEVFDSGHPPSEKTSPCLTSEKMTRLSGRTRRGEAGRADVQGDMVDVTHGDAASISKHWMFVNVSKARMNHPNKSPLYR